jgi:hypothetical protein
MLDLAALETLDRALVAASQGALPPVAFGDSPRDISGQKMDKAQARCPFSGRGAA